MNDTTARAGAAGFTEMRRRLQARRGECRDEIRELLLRADNEHYLELAGSVHDIAEASVADLLVDLGIETVNRLVQEVRDIDAALLRIAAGEYGVCTDCGQSIEPARLSAYQTAKRCQSCQRHYEASHAGATHASL